MATRYNAKPLQTLSEFVRELEAAILVCLEDPAKKPVHRLRTTTRRVEAQLILLSILRVPKVHGEEARKAARLLKKIRRSAGHVRDLDVQQDLIADNTPSNARDDAGRLRKTLEEQRTDTAKELQDYIEKHRHNLARALESLLNALKRSETLTVPSSKIATLSVDWFVQNAPAKSDNPDSLHTIRKRAKIARYLAESAPKSAHTPRKLAAAFEAVQQSGGEWHDWLILGEIARDELGGSSPLTKAFQDKCRRALNTYQTHLAQSTPGISEPPKAQVHRAA
jgi:CHAD domain-containing protein